MKIPMRLIRVWLPVTAALVLFASSATAYTVTLNGGGTSTLTTKTGVFITQDVDSVNPAALPYSDISTSEFFPFIKLEATSESGYNLTDAGFNITLDHYRSNTGFAFAESKGNIFFSVDENIDYVASGSYIVDSGSSVSFVFYSAILRDLTDSSDLLNSEQQSSVTVNENFTLGGTGGDDQNTDIGSLTGVLLAGHNYELLYRAGISSNAGSDATATGGFFLSFSSITDSGSDIPDTGSVIPEPSAALLFGTGFAVVAVARRRAAS